MLQQLPPNQETFFLREKLSLAQMTHNYNVINSNSYTKEIDDRINEINLNLTVPYFTTKIQSNQFANIELKPQRKKSLTHLFSDAINQLERFSARYDVKPLKPCSFVARKTTSLGPSKYFQALKQQGEYNPAQVPTKSVKQQGNPSFERSFEERPSKDQSGEKPAKKGSLNNFHVQHSQMIFHCAECKINWITGSSKRHECKFNRQYASRERHDFQAPLPRKVARLVDRISDYTTSKSNLQRVRVSVGVTNEVYKTSLQNPHLRNYSEQVYFVFYTWALNQLANCSANEIITRLVIDLMDKGKADLVFSLWSYDDYSFI